MAVIFKKKEAKVGGDSGLTEREKTNLQALGLYESPEPPTSKVFEPKKPAFPMVDGKGEIPVGSRVRIAYDTFSWMGTRKVGDVGVVMQSWPPIKEIKEDRERYYLYQVKLDEPRTKEGLVLMRSWELEPVPDSSVVVGCNKEG